MSVEGVVHRVAGAVAASVPIERMYSVSLGSQQGNTHLHWHIAPLLPGVPYDQHQPHALSADHGALAVDDNSRAALAQTIKSHR